MRMLQDLPFQPGWLQGDDFPINPLGLWESRQAGGEKSISVLRIWGGNGGVCWLTGTFRARFS